MVTTAVHYERSGTSEPETEPGWFLGLLLHRRGLVLLTALLFMVLAGVAGRDAGDKLVSGAYLDPSADSQQAAELLTHQFPGGPPNLVLIVETSSGTVDSPEATQSGRAVTEQLSETPGVAGVQSYWTTPDPSLRAADDRSALIALQLTGGEHAAQETAGRIIDDLEEASSGLRVSPTGPAAVGAGGLPHGHNRTSRESDTNPATITHSRYRSRTSSRWRMTCARGVLFVGIDVKGDAAAAVALAPGIYQVCPPSVESPIVV